MIQLTSQEKTLSQPLDKGFFNIQDNKEEHITTVRSEAERVINRTLPVCRPLTEVMSVQHYRSYEAFLLGFYSIIQDTYRATFLIDVSILGGVWNSGAAPAEVHRGAAVCF